MDVTMEDKPISEPASTSKTGVTYIPSLAPTIPYIEKLTEQSSTIDSDQQMDCARPTETVTNVNRPHIDTWQNLTNQALSNKGASWSAAPTQVEQHKLLRDRTQEKRLARDQHIAWRDNIMTVTRPPTRRAAVAARQQIKDERQASAAKRTTDRIQKFKKEKTAVARRAKEAAIAQGLERALRGLDLNARSGDTKPPRDSLLLTDRYACSLLCKDHPQKVKIAFYVLRKRHENSWYPQIILDEEVEHCISKLQEAEDHLQSLAQEQGGSIEAALLYQDERVAEAIGLAALRGKYADLEDVDLDAVSDLEDGGNKDNQTAKDLETYRLNPSIESRLSRKRQNRLRLALEFGRTDFNLMRLEKRRARLEEMRKQGKKTKYELKGKEQKRRNAIKVMKRGDSYHPMREGGESWDSYRPGRAGTPAPAPEIAKESGSSQQNPVDDKQLRPSASRAIIDPFARALHDSLNEEKKKREERERSKRALEEGMRALHV
ncbi:MAG: hypothetical protein Q9201_003872 [Fulgogasparrea decipioides]